MYLYKLYSEKRESMKPCTGGGGITGGETESILHPAGNDGGHNDYDDDDDVGSYFSEAVRVHVHRAEVLQLR